MKLKEFLQTKKILNKQTDITFTIAKAVKDEHTPFYHNEFYQTPIRSISEWLNLKEEYIVINPDACPIDITGTWQKWYMKGRLLNAVITTEKDLFTHYSESQAKEMINYYDELVKKWLEKEK